MACTTAKVGVVVLAVALGAACGGNSAVIPSGQTGPMTFFVSSATSTTGNLGGLSGADATCQRLATAAGAGGHTWRAYLSADRDPDTGAPVNARSRIGIGPWRNANGELIGLAFDGNYEALSHKIAFDKDLNRTICVDVRYVLWCIDKLGGAPWIINELKLVK